MNISDSFCGDGTCCLYLETLNVVLVFFTLTAGFEAKIEIVFLIVLYVYVIFLKNICTRTNLRNKCLFKLCNYTYI